MYNEGYDNIDHRIVQLTMLSAPTGPVVGYATAVVGPVKIGNWPVLEKRNGFGLKLGVIRSLVQGVPQQCLYLPGQILTSLETAVTNMAGERART